MTVDGSGLADAFNDLTPLVFKTADFGKTWTRIVEGIDTEAWARVVREDGVRKDRTHHRGVLAVVRHGRATRIDIT